jgi:hypothetical protein
MGNAHPNDPGLSLPGAARNIHSILKLVEHNSCFPQQYFA